MLGQFTMERLDRISEKPQNPKIHAIISTKMERALLTNQKGHLILHRISLN